MACVNQGVSKSLNGVHLVNVTSVATECLETMSVTDRCCVLPTQSFLSLTPPPPQASTDYISNLKTYRLHILRMVRTGQGEEAANHDASW